MNLLLVYATHLEAASLRSKFGDSNVESSSFWNFTHKKVNVDVLVSGVGLVNTAFQLGKTLSSSKYDFAINVGVAGSFDRSLKLGTVVNVMSECLS